MSSGHHGISKGEWNRHKLVGNELRNKILGVIGLGKIGREVMKRCRSFNMKILGYDPYVTEDQFQLDELEHVLKPALLKPINAPLQKRLESVGKQSFPRK